MMQIDSAILATDKVICKNISRFDDSERGLLSQNILAQLRNFVEYIADKVYANGSDLDPNNYALNVEALKYLQTRGDLRFLHQFHELLQKSVSHYTLDENGSERLMLKYYEYLLKIKIFLNDTYGLHVLDNIEVEDDVTCYLEYENGATGVFVTSTADAPGTNRFEVLGTGGKIVCENDKLKLYKNEIDERKFNQEYKGGFGSPKFEEIEVETDGENLQHTGICRNFTNAILGIEPLFVDGKEGLKSVELMDAMLMSTWLNKMIELPIDDEKYYELLLKQIKNSKIHKNVEEKILDTKDTYNGSK